MKQIKNLNENVNLNKIDIAATGKNIKRLCEQYAVTRDYLAAILGLTSIQAVDHYFYGNNLPSIESFLILSAIFKKPIEEILVLKGDLEGLLRTTSFIEIDTENKTVNSELFYKKYPVCPITNFEELGTIWYSISECLREDIKKRIFDGLLSGYHIKDIYIQTQFRKAFEYKNLP